MSAVQEVAAMAAGNLGNQLCEESICPVCWGYFTNPVTTQCGHSFCRACLSRSLGEPGRNAPCPTCGAPVQQDNLTPNQQLASIVETTRQRCGQGTKRAGGVCERHQEPLKLFCWGDRTPICMVCDKSRGHKDHNVSPADEAADDYKEKMQEQIPFLETEREKLVEQKEAEEQRSQPYLEQIEDEKKMITSLFEQMHKLLEEKKRTWLMQLAALEKDIKERQEENLTKLSGQISHFSELIKDVELQCQQPPSDFLQDITCTMSRYQVAHVTRLVEFSPSLEWIVKNDCQKSSVFLNAMKSFEGSLIRELRKVSVTLDPNTAHPFLMLTGDRKSVSWGKGQQNLPDKLEKFDIMTCVLGCERFSSGRHWWVVEVKVEKERQEWAVGVARESLKRKGEFAINPNEGIWAVGKAAEAPLQLCAFTDPELTLLTSRHELRMIQVILDCEEGSVEFFDADKNSLIFRFPPDSLSRTYIRPFFKVHEGVCLKC